MPYDPTLPVNQSPVGATEMRNQLNALKDLIDAKPSMDDVNTDIPLYSAANVDRIYPVDCGVSDPPTKDEVQAIYDRLNSLITALHR